MKKLLRTITCTITITAIIVIASLSPTHAATLDPSYKFQTIETEHFYIHFHDELTETAPHAARQAEIAHANLTNTLGYTPTQKTHLVLTDSTDMANGYATVLPYNLIYVYAVPPEPYLSIGQYEDWLKMVITHEYAHIISMDAHRGYSTVMRRIFGKPIPGMDPISFLAFLFTAPPNTMLPNWWLEGLAVWTETEFTEIGRGKGTYFETVFRAAVAQDNLPAVDMINGEYPKWPSRSMPYIYGLALMRHISDKYGTDTLGELLIAHSGRLPYMITAPAINKTKNNYTGLFNEAMNELRQDQTEKINKISADGLTIPALYPAHGESMTAPTPSPDGKRIAATVSDPHKHRAIVIMDSDSGEIIDTFKVRPTDSSITWSPDGQYIYFTEAELHRGYNLILDLYRYDTVTRKKTRITDGARVKDPSISQDGTIAAIKISPEGQGLALIEPDTSKIDALMEYKNMRLSSPSFHPTEQQIVYVTRDDKMNSALMLYDLSTNEARTFMQSSDSIISPRFTPDGETILYISDTSGVFNIHRFELATGKQNRITNLLGGAMHLNIGHSDEGMTMYISAFTGKGFRAAYIPLTKEMKTYSTDKIITPQWSGLITNAASPELNVTESPLHKLSANKSQATEIPQADGLAIRAKNYSALKSALPKFWLPMLWADHDGMGGGVFTAGQDALSYHTYILSAAVGGGGRGYWQGAYRWDRYYPSITLIASRLPMLYYDFFALNESLWDEETIASASIGLPLKRLEIAMNLELGYERREHMTLYGMLPVFEGRRDNIFATLLFANTGKYPYSISRERGRALELTVRDFSRKRGSLVDSREYEGRYEEFIPFGSHRVLYLMLGGGASLGDQIPQQAFHLGGTLNENLKYPLRGYPAGYRGGDYIAVSTLELRVPLSNIQRGSGTLPIYSKQLHLALFMDAGGVWDQGVEPDSSMFDLGAGIEIRLDMSLGYKLSATPTIGYAHGFSDERGEDQIYFVIHAEL